MNPKRKDLALQLLEMIRRGEVVRDGRLPTERELASLLGESRQMIREAVIVLETWGVLEVRERQGMFVKSFDASELVEGLESMIAWPDQVFPEVLEMRPLIEVPAARMACRRRTEEQIHRLTYSLEELCKLKNDRSDLAVSEGVRWNSLLHATIIDAAGNTILKRVHEGLSGILERAVKSLRIQRLTQRSLEWSGRVYAQHERLVRAIVDSDEEEAARAMEEHLEDTARAFLDGAVLPRF